MGPRRKNGREMGVKLLASSGLANLTCKLANTNKEHFSITDYTTMYEEEYWKEEDKEERRLRQRQEDQFSFWLLALSFFGSLRIYNGSFK
jgi:hypothetical protein